MKIKAAVLHSAGEPYTIESIEIDDPRDDEILVENIASGICHTDMMVAEGRVHEQPVILGHEGAGVVLQVGKNVKTIQPGDHVIMSYQSCGECESCKDNRPWKCERIGDLNFGFMRRDGTSGYSKSGVGGHFFGQSSFATHSLATESNCVKVSKDLDLSIVCPLGCGIQTGAGTIMNLMKVPAESSVAVFGSGAVGIAAIMAAHILGVKYIIGIDIHDSRLDTAKELGATHVINSRIEDVPAVIKSITGAGVDYTLDMTGIEAVSELAVKVLNPGGSFANVARPGQAPEMTDGKISLGVTMGSAISQEFLPQLIRHYQAGDFPFDRLEKFYAFEDINQAMADSHNGTAIKPILRIK